MDLICLALVVCSSPCRGASSFSASVSEGAHRMTLLYAIGGVISVGLLVYLFVALLAPERF